FQASLPLASCRFATVYRVATLRKPDQDLTRQPGGRVKPRLGTESSQAVGQPTRLVADSLPRSRSRRTANLRMQVLQERHHSCNTVPCRSHNFLRAPTGGS